MHFYYASDTEKTVGLLGDSDGRRALHLSASQPPLWHEMKPSRPQPDSLRLGEEISVLLVTAEYLACLFALSHGSQHGSRRLERFI